MNKAAHQPDELLRRDALKGALRPAWDYRPYRFLLPSPVQPLSAFLGACCGAAGRLGAWSGWNVRTPRGRRWRDRP